MSDDNKEIDIPRLMAEIRERVKSEIEQNGRRRPAFAPKIADHDQGASRKAGELLYSEELRYLNEHYSYMPRLNLEGVTSHRKGPVARGIVKFKRKVLAIVWDHLLKDYFEGERQYQAHLVRLLNDVAKYVDARDASNFWELIRKIDYDVTKALERIERISDEQSAARYSSERGLHDALHNGLTELQRRIEALTTTSEQQGQKLNTLESVASGLESIVARLGSPRPSAPATDVRADELVDNSYLLLENRFRGSEKDIAGRLEIYPPLFKANSARKGRPVLDLGGGRGELVALLSKDGVSCYGIDSDKGMVEEAQAHGHDVRFGEGLSHLESLADDALGGLVAIQVVEHLKNHDLQRLCQLAAQKVVLGGLVIFETINPRSLLALSSNYFRDPTHQWPLHPDTLSYTMELCGLAVREVRELSPVPQDATLKHLDVEEYMTPRWAFAVERINGNFTRLNQLLFGFQDYCIVAAVRKEGHGG